MNKLSSNNMNADYISQHDIVQRYLKGKLTPEETVEFEEYILDKPELLEQLEVDSVMSEHLPNIAPKRSRRSIFRLLSNLLPWGISALCSVMLVTVLIQNRDTTDLIQNNSQIYYVENLRSMHSSKQESISVNEDTTALVVVLTPQVLSVKHQIKLLDSASHELIYSNEQTLSEFGQLNVIINKNILERGAVLLEAIPLATENQDSNARLSMELIFNREKAK